MLANPLPLRTSSRSSKWPAPQLPPPYCLTIHVALGTWASFKKDCAAPQGSACFGVPNQSLCWIRISRLKAPPTQESTLTAPDSWNGAPAAKRKLGAEQRIAEWRVKEHERSSRIQTCPSCVSSTQTSMSVFFNSSASSSPGGHVWSMWLYCKNGHRIHRPCHRRPQLGSPAANTGIFNSAQALVSLCD